MTTQITIQFNMGYLDGEEEKKMKLTESDAGQSEKADLMRHLADIMPDSEEYGVSAITVDQLDTESLLVNGETYNMQMRFTIHHETPLSDESVQTIIDAIYENGANASYTPNVEDAYPHTFAYPYNSVVAQ